MAVHENSWVRAAGFILYVFWTMATWALFMGSVVLIAYISSLLGMHVHWTAFVAFPVALLLAAILIGKWRRWDGTMIRVDDGHKHHGYGNDLGPR